MLQKKLLIKDINLIMPISAKKNCALAVTDFKGAAIKNYLVWQSVRVCLVSVSAHSAVHFICKGEYKTLRHKTRSANPAHASLLQREAAAEQDL